MISLFRKMFKKNKRKDNDKAILRKLNQSEVEIKNLEAKVDRLERQLNSLATHLGCSGILTAE